MRIVADIDREFSAIGDRGTTKTVTSVAEAKRLRNNGIIDRIDWVKPGGLQEVMIFGKAGAREPVVAHIYGKGLLTDVAVVYNIESTLIADTDFTRYGIALVQDDIMIIGVHRDGIVFVGHRDPNAPQGTVNQLWQLNFEKLLQQPKPSTQQSISAQQIVEGLARTHLEAEEGEFFAGQARPTWKVHRLHTRSTQGN